MAMRKASLVLLLCPSCLVTVSFSKPACDFLGGRLAGALGLNAAKYQYAIDQYHRDLKVMSNARGTKEAYRQKINQSAILDTSMIV